MVTVQAATLAGRSALVTGASSGIGASIARRLLDGGAKVHGLARRKERLELLAPDELRSGAFVPHAVDVNDTESLAEIVREIGETEPLDIVVLAAGTNIPNRRFHELTEESFAGIMHTNVTGVFTVLRTTLPYLRRHGGDVVVVSSIAASWPDHSGAAYGASKSALLGLVRGASRDEHGYGIRFCTILPGIVDTEILDRRPVPPPREIRDWAVSPDDIAEAVHMAVSLPPRTNIAEISVVATRLQALSDTQQATPELPWQLTEDLGSA